MRESQENVQRERRLQFVSFILHATRGLVREPGVRRKLMLGAIVVAALLAFAGATFLSGFLNPREHLWRFILFWLACAWFTATALLLALFDVLMVRAQGRAARRALRGQYEQPEAENDRQQ